VSAKGTPGVRAGYMATVNFAAFNRKKNCMQRASRPQRVLKASVSKDHEQVKRAKHSRSNDQRPRKSRSEAVVRQVAQEKMQEQVDNEEDVQAYDQPLVRITVAEQQPEQERVQRDMQQREGEVSRFLSHPSQDRKYSPFLASDCIHFVGQQKTKSKEKEEVA
jgi:hypothetical protein